MANLLDQKDAISLLRENGWERTRGGKHVVKMVKQGHRPITLPHHHGSTYSKGLTAAIRTQAGLDQDKDSPSASRSSSITTDRSIGPRSPSSRDASPPAEL